MPVYELPKKERLDISDKIEGVEDAYYTSIFAELEAAKKSDEQFSSEEAYERVKYIIANYTFLIYERLEQKIVRDISYKQVKRWAIKNQELVRYLFKKQFKDFELTAFDNWVQPEVEIQQMGMYASSMRKTKNIYH